MSDRLIHRLRAVQNEYLTAHTALTHVERRWGDLDGRPEWEGRTLFQIRRTLARLESTYVIRLFCEFEGILREYWAAGGNDPEGPNVNYLIDQVGMPHMDPRLRERVHEVQHHRNDLVHRPAAPGDLPLIAPRVPVIPFGEVLSR